MANFSQQALLTYAQNRDRPNALLTLAASVTPAEAKAAPKKITIGSGGKVKPKKAKGSGRPGQIYELFHDPINASYKMGKPLGRNIGGHGGHVHVAAEKRRVEYLGKVAQRMGLRVGEQDKFGGRPSGGHAANSWHYKGMAIDVSGDPKRMAAFAKLVKRQYRLG